MADSGFLSQKVKLEMRTPLEQFFLGGVLISPVFIFIGYRQMGVGDTPALFLGAIITFLLSLFLLYGTDNYYLLDFEKHSLIYRFKFLFYERLSKVTDFSGIHAVTVDTITIRGKNGSTGYLYVPTLVLSSGKVISVLDRKFTSAHARKLAEFIGKGTGAKYIAAIGTSKMIVARLPDGRYSFTAKSNVPTALQETLSNVFAFLMILVAVPFIALILYHFASAHR